MIPDRLRHVWLVVVAVLLVADAAFAQQPVQTPLLLMTSIDGLRPDFVTAADQHGVKIPNLRRFLAEGAFAARYRRVMQHRGHKKAVVAVAHAMLVTAYHLLARKTPYHDPGADYYDRRHTERARRRAIQALERQGYRVILEPAA